MKRIIAISLISVLIIGLLTCTILGAPKKKPDTFHLGVLLPFTGTFAAVAKTQEQGALLAVDEINEKDLHSFPTRRSSDLLKLRSKAHCSQWMKLTKKAGLICLGVKLRLKLRSWMMRQISMLGSEDSGI